MTTFTFDGHDYQDAGDIIYDAEGNEVAYIELDEAQEYWIAENADDLTGLLVQRVHVEHPNARQAAIECCLAGIA